jgi:hypothetical protein
MPIEERVEELNHVRSLLHDVSPFKNEPVDFVQWVASGHVKANDYNPNVVAPPEMELLKISIREDGYTQPIVAWSADEHLEVVDGFHRHRVGSECEIIKDRIKGYLPVVAIRKEQTDRSNRIASTIRHNRARGKHVVDSMSDIVIELKNRNWADERIARELGMDQDEILRLCQITGLSELFKDDDFSRSWDIKDSSIGHEELTDQITSEEKEQLNFWSVNTSDESRIFHTFEKWECHKAGMYATHKEGMSGEECEKEYARFLKSDDEFKDALAHIIAEWKYSCEHYLTNSAMNRIAWLGQASMCYATGIPAVFRGGFSYLSEDEQQHANEIACEYLNKWLVANGRPEVSLQEAITDSQVDIY